MCCKLRLAILMATMIVPVTVMAENDELDSLDGPDSSVELVDKSEDPSTEILPEIGDEDQLAVFVLDRGLYFASEVGVFINLGGLNGNSNLQPFISTTLGIDIDEIFSGQFVVFNAVHQAHFINLKDVTLKVPGSQADYILQLCLRVLDFALFFWKSAWEHSKCLGTRIPSSPF